MNQSFDETLAPDNVHRQENPVTGSWLPKDPSTIAKPGDDSSITPNGPPQIPGFEIEKELGRGGMGVVYRARELALNRVVALKMILNSGHATANELVRFLSEAEAIAKLQHPNIVQIHSLGKAGELPYFAMEFVDGGTLADLIRENPLEPKRAARLVEQLAEAMAFSHESGIIHRDLKPANVLMLRDGTPKITDFGLAKRTDSGAGLTVTGQPMGTPSYMAPEQAQGDLAKVNESSDVYALGAVLYHLLTGRPPFLGPTALATMDQVIKSEPISPRELQSGVSRDLETICLKCLRKNATERYPTAKALADDLRSFLDERSISARPMGRIEKGYKWVKKNPGISAMLAFVAVTLLSATFISLSFANQSAKDLKKAENALADANEQKKSRALAQVNTLLTADPRAVPSILENLETDREVVLPRLMEVWDQPKTPKDQLRVGLALLPVETEMVRDFLVKRMLEVPDPAELVVIRDSLSSFMDSRAEPLWQQLDDKSITENQRLRLLAALAKFDAKNPKWNEIGDRILKPWLSDQPLYLGTWTHALRPVRSSLIPSVQKVFRGEVLPDMKYVAANILGDYASNQPEVLATLMQIADDRQFQTLFPVLEKHKAKAIDLLRKEAGKLPPKDDFPEDESIKKWKSDWTQEEHEVFAKKRSGAAVSLLRLGDPESVWPVLKSSPYPESRTRAIHRFASTNADAKMLIEQLKIEKDVGIRRALILSLGEYRADQIPEELRQPLIDLLLKWYRDDSDSGIHGAIDWLLRPEKDGLQDRPLKWGQREKLEQIDREMMEIARRQKLSGILSLFSPASDPFAGSRLLLPTPSPKSGSWWVNGQGQKFAVVESRTPFAMGSPEDERERRTDETLHWRKIDRKFGMMTKAVTVAEFQRFLKANPKIRWNYGNDLKQYAPDQDCPMVIVSWWEAAQYCRWLSEQEGLPEWEIVYPSIAEIEKGKNEEQPLVLPANHLSRKGYRLPTEAEWEYLARSGSRTSYFFGSDLELLPRHSWFTTNSKNRSWPVGQKQPNDWGLFDLSGNTFTWCQEAGFLYNEGTLEKPFPDIEEKQSITLQQGIAEKLLRSLRGGSFNLQSDVVRSSYHFNDRPSARGDSFGLRLSRTFD